MAWWNLYLNVNGFCSTFSALMPLAFLLSIMSGVATSSPIGLTTTLMQLADRWSCPSNMMFGSAAAGRQRLPGNQRGGTDDVIAIPGFWLDVDFVHAVHAKAAHLPPDLEAAMGLIREFPLAPSLIIHSGHGIQVYWLFKELWTFDSPEERERAQAMLNCFKATFVALAAAHKWKIDATADLARVLRVPGTMNRKESGHVLPVLVIEEDSERRYDPSDFEPHLVDVVEQPKTEPTVRPDVRERAISTDDKAVIDKISRIQTMPGCGAAISAATHRNPKPILPLRAALGFSSAGIRAGSKASLVKAPWRIGKSGDVLIIARTPSTAHVAGKSDAYDWNRKVNGNGSSNGNGSAPEVKDSGPVDFPLTDAGNGERLMHRHGDKLRFIALRKKWAIYDGMRWRIDDTGGADRLAIETLRDVKRKARSLPSWRKTKRAHSRLENAQVGSRL